MTNMIANAGEDEIPPEVRARPQGEERGRITYVSFNITKGMELQAVGRLDENGDAAFMEWALNPERKRVER